MTQTRLALTLALTLLLGACSHLPGGSADSEDLIEAAGVDQMLEALSHPVPTRNVGTPDLLLPGELVSATNESIGSVLKPKEVHDALKANIDKSMSPEEIAIAVAFYKSPSGKAVVAVEGGQPGHNTDGNDPRAIAQLDDATGNSKIFVGLADRTLSSTLSYANDRGCFGLARNKFAGYLGAVIKKALLGAVRDSIRDQMQRRYDSLAPDALDAYVHFAQSAAGSKFFAARNDAVNSNLQALSGAMSEALTAEVTQQCGQPGNTP